MTNDELDASVIASMLHIRGRVQPFMKHRRTHPADAINIPAIAWEIRKRHPELDPEPVLPPGPPLWQRRQAASIALTNRVALSLRRLHCVFRVERFPSGRRRDAPKYRALHLLEALARASV